MGEDARWEEEIQISDSDSIRINASGRASGEPQQGEKPQTQNMPLFWSRKAGWTGGTSLMLREPSPLVQRKNRELGNAILSARRGGAVSRAFPERV